MRLAIATFTVTLTLFATSVFAGQCDANMSGGDRRLHYKSYQICKSEAEQGDPAAQYWLGFMLKFHNPQRMTQGQVVSTDYPGAIEWLKKASAQGEPRAMQDLGELYIGYIHAWKPDNPALEQEGLKLLEMAAAKGTRTKGSSGATLALEWYYEQKDIVMSYAWCRVRERLGYTQLNGACNKKMGDEQKLKGEALADTWMKANNL